MPEPDLLAWLSDLSPVVIAIFVFVKFFPWASVAEKVFGREPKRPPSGETVAETVLRRFREDEYRKHIQSEIRDHSRTTADALVSMNGKLATSIDLATENMRLNTERHEQTTTLITSLAKLLEQAQQERDA